jgi:glutamate synthase domain-containing protein 3
MTAPARGAGAQPAHDAASAPASEVVVSVPDIRDYQRINAELVQRLDAGASRVRLGGAEGQRLLLAGLVGGWSAVVEIEGIAGPELAAGLDAPGLTVVAQGASADGAGAGLRAGRLILLGPTVDVLGRVQEGGTILAAAAAGHRAGLGQRGGVLVLFGSAGRLAGERQAGGRLFARRDRLGPHAGHGRLGGTFRLLSPVPGFGLAGEEAALLESVLDAAAPWVAAHP